MSRSAEIDRDMAVFNGEQGEGGGGGKNKGVGGSLKGAWPLFFKFLSFLGLPCGLISHPVQRLNPYESAGKKLLKAYKVAVKTFWHDGHFGLISGIEN